MRRDTGNAAGLKVLYRYCIPAALLAWFLLLIVIDKVNYNNDFIVFTYSKSSSIGTQ